MYKFFSPPCKAILGIFYTPLLKKGDSHMKKVYNFTLADTVNTLKQMHCGVIQIRVENFKNMHENCQQSEFNDNI